MIKLIITLLLFAYTPFAQAPTKEFLSDTEQAEFVQAFSVEEIRLQELEAAKARYEAAQAMRVSLAHRFYADNGKSTKMYDLIWDKTAKKWGFVKKEEGKEK